MFGMAMENAEMWFWAHKHPYLFTLIKISTPTLIVCLMYVAGRIMIGGSRR